MALFLCATFLLSLLLWPGVGLAQDVVRHPVDSSAALRDRSKPCDTDFNKQKARKAGREALRKTYPDLSEARLSELIEYGEVKQRQRLIRKCAYEIVIRERYPHLSEEERTILLGAALGTRTTTSDRLDAVEDKLDTLLLGVHPLAPSP